MALKIEMLFGMTYPFMNTKHMILQKMIQILVLVIYFFSITRREYVLAHLRQQAMNREGENDSTSPEIAAKSKA